MTEPSRGVELSVNTCPADAGFFELTYRHIVDQLGPAAQHRRIVVDWRTEQGTGRFAPRRSASGSDRSEARREALRRALDRLVAEDLVDEVVDVPWDDETTTSIAQRYFGRPDAPVAAENGSPIHQYLWAIETAGSPYVLHLDSDMLAHLVDKGAWIREGIDLMQERSAVVVVTPQGGPPQAQTVADWVVGPRLRRVRRRPESDSPWHRSSDLSTRVMLLDVERFRMAAPFAQCVEGELLERTLTRSFVAQGLERWSRNDDETWMIHPRRHNEFHHRYLPELIALVASGTAPFRRSGYRWDVRTEGRHFAPWLMLILWRRLIRRRPRGRWSSAPCESENELRSGGQAVR